MKTILITATACLALLASCGAPETYTQSKVRQNFHPPTAGPKIRVMLEGDESGFVSSDQAQKEEMRTAIGEALKEKGWEPTSQIKGSDYVLMCGYTINDSGPLSYNVTTTPTVTGSTSTVTSNKAYVTSFGMWLKKVNSKGGPGEEVWSGVGTNAAGWVGGNEFRTDMALSLIEEQFPNRKP